LPDASRRSIFITGAGSGIGRATAVLFASRGWFCGLFDIDAAGIAETARLLGPAGHTTGILDVRDRTAWTGATAAFHAAAGGRFDVLMNNAGVGRHGWFEEISAEDSDWILDVNVRGVMYGIRAALPLLEATPGARILNVASAAALYGSPRLAAYSASKFAVRALTEALDLEFERKGIRVVSLMPYFVETPILDMGTGPASNHVMRDEIMAGGMSVYPVELAAERAWQAVHGQQTHVTVGRDAGRTRFAARFTPNALRRALSKSLRRLG